MQDASRESALLRAMTLIATVTAAAEVTFGMRERKAGRDPSGQEHDEVVRPFLRDAADEIRRVLLQIRASLVVGASSEENVTAQQVRRFTEIHQLRRLAPTMQRTHQRLLSLYPLVSEELAEEARALFVQMEALIQHAHDAEYPDAAEALIKRSMLFCERLLREIDATQKPY